MDGPHVSIFYLVRQPEAVKTREARAGGMKPVILPSLDSNIP